jgi:hypothetical protein
MRLRELIIPGGGLAAFLKSFGRRRRTKVLEERTRGPADRVDCAMEISS